MGNFRADEPGRGGKVDLAVTGKATAAEKVAIAESAGISDGDVIRGLRSGLIFSLAIWAMLFGVGTLFFS